MQVLLLYPEVVPDRYHSAVLYDAALEDVAAGRVVNSVALADPTLGSSLSIDPDPAPS